MSHLYLGIISYIVEPAVRALFFGGLMAVVIAIARFRNVHFRLSCWTLVLYGALAMPVLGLVLPSMSMPIVSSPSDQPSSIAAPVPTVDNLTPPIKRTSQDSLIPDSESRTAATVLRQQPRPTAARNNLPWQPLAVGLYLTVALLLLLHYLVGWAVSRRILLRSTEVIDSGAVRRLEICAAELGIKEQPALFQSAAVAVPVTIGVFKPVILLPENWYAWSGTKLGAVLAHELSHIARRDTLTQTLSVIHRALFWFSPLGWLLHRHLVDLAEQASDDYAVRAAGDPDYYAEVLLGFFRAARAAGGRARLAGVCMAQSSRAERRIDRILSGAFGSSSTVRRPVMTALAILFVSLACVAATLSPTARASKPEGNGWSAVKNTSWTPKHNSSTDFLTGTISLGGCDQNTAPPAPAAPPAAPEGPAASAPAQPAAPEPPPVGEARCVGEFPPPAPPSPESAPCPGGPSLPVAAPAPPPAPKPCRQASRPRDTEAVISPRALDQSSSSTYKTSGGGSHNEEPFVIVSGNKARVSVAQNDLKRAIALRQQIKGCYIWFRRNGKEYVVTDPDTVKAALDFFAPMDELGRQQAKLGREQADLGARQADLAAQQQSMDRAALPKVEEEIKRLQAQIRKTSDDQDLARLQERLAKLEAESAKARERAAQGQAALASGQEELSRLQGELGDAQGQLGEQQSRYAEEATRGVEKLLDLTLSNGLARPQ